MAKSRTRDRIGEEDIAAIIAAVARHPGGADRETIAKALPRKLAPRTLQFWLKNLIDDGRLRSEGAKRAVRYHVPATTITTAAPVTTLPETETAAVVPVSPVGAAIQQYLSKPV